MIFTLKHYSDAGHINIGSGTDWSIIELANAICRVVGFEGKIAHDLTKPDGTPRKLMNSDKLASMGWKPTTSLEEGLTETYKWYLANVA